MSDDWGEIVCNGCVLKAKATSFPRWTLGSILIVLSQLSGAGCFLSRFVGFFFRCKGLKLEV